jgi:hypothetical protein
MNDLKKQIIAVLADSGNPAEQFNKAFELYRKCPGKSPGVERTLNRVGFTQDTLKNLKYDLQKLAGIRDVEIAVASVSKTGQELPEDVKVNEIIVNDFEDVFEEKILSDFIEEAAEDKKALREEFSFLDKVDCPDEFYVIVGRKIATFRRYQENHAKLQTLSSGELKLSEDEQLQLTQTVEADFRENRLLWDELNHYNTTGEILGKHIIFREKAIAKEVEMMDSKKLLNFVNSSTKYFHDQVKAKEKYAQDPEKLESIEQKIADREFKLSLVKKKLGVNE